MGMMCTRSASSAALDCNENSGPRVHASRHGHLRSRAGRCTSGIAFKAKARIVS